MENRSSQLELSQTFEPRIGAEARVELTSWFGEPVIRKIRISKSYRNSDLDRILRAQRTREEVEILHQAKLAGVVCPFVKFADPKRFEILMEYIQGYHMKDLENIEADKKQVDKWYHRLGDYAARLHAKNIIHGDLTTKNVIISGERLVLIDFGLSFVSDRLEDRAEDLHLLKQAFKSTLEQSSASYAFERVIQGYEAVVGKKETGRLLRQISKIEARGRYARVD